MKEECCSFISSAEMKENKPYLEAWSWCSTGSYNKGLFASNVVTTTSVVTTAKVVTTAPQLQKTVVGSVTEATLGTVVLTPVQSVQLVHG